MVPGKVLKGLGFEVHEAQDGEEGLQVLAQDNEIILVLLDWRMEGMDGFEFITRLRAEERYADLPVLMITVENTKDKVLAACKAGVTDYLLKPFNKALLVAKLERLGLAAID